MKKIEITCDSCNRDLSITGAMPEYRLVLSCEALPHEGNVCLSLSVYPPIDNDKHFCGLVCLKKWLDVEIKQN